MVDSHIKYNERLRASDEGFIPKRPISPLLPEKDPWKPKGDLRKDHDEDEPQALEPHEVEHPHVNISHIEIRRDADAVVLRVNLITAPQTISEPLEYTFGFQATPVKPAKPDVWDYRICHMGRYGLQDSLLDRLAELGIRTICFHEHWTDIQAYPKTTHGEKLRKLVDACHARGIQILLYHGYEMSTIAPEWAEYHERCLVHPRRGGYKRKYQPEPDQTAYIVCYRSQWQDFIAYHLADHRPLNSFRFLDGRLG